MENGTRVRVAGEGPGEIIYIGLTWITVRLDSGKDLEQVNARDLESI